MNDFYDSFRPGRGYTPDESNLLGYIRKGHTGLIYKFLIGRPTFLKTRSPEWRERVLNAFAPDPNYGNERVLSCENGIRLVRLWKSGIFTLKEVRPLIREYSIHPYILFGYNKIYQDKFGKWDLDNLPNRQLEMFSRLFRLRDIALTVTILDQREKLALQWMLKTPELLSQVEMLEILES